MTKKIRDCLAALGDVDLQGCESMAVEYARIKKAFHKQVLVCHPDKGGNAEDFRRIRTAFEVLRDMYEKGKVTSFAVNQSQEADHYDQTFQEFGDMPTPSWDYYYAAAAEEIPLYRVENAKSGRSKCKQKGKAKKCEDATIAQGEIRVGSLLEDTGSYTRWNHLDCWRVPSKIWLGLPHPETCQDPDLFAQALHGMNQVLFCGIDTLNEEGTQKLLAHVMNKENWARLVKRKEKAPKKDDMVYAPGPDTQQVVPQGYLPDRQVFVPPNPGKNGAQAEALNGKRVVLTGTFPEVGGGAGLNLGKDKVRAIVESFGGRVTSSVSGKTDILIVGKEPGYSSVSKARERQIQLVTLHDLKEGLEGRCLEGMQRPISIDGFSSGYRGNSLALQAPGAARALMADLVDPKLALNNAPKAPPPSASGDDAKPKAAEKKAATKNQSSKMKSAPKRSSQPEDSKPAAQQDSSTVDDSKPKAAAKSSKKKPAPKRAQSQEASKPAAKRSRNVKGEPKENQNNAITIATGTGSYTGRVTRSRSRKA